MVHVVLWLSILSFTLLFAGFGAELLAWLRRREAWRAFHLCYLGIYTVFSLLQTLAYFGLEYLEEPPRFLLAAFGYFRTAVSILLIVALSLYLASAAGLRPGKAGRAARAALFIPAAAIIAGVLLLLAGGPAALGAILNLAFNLFAALASLLASFRVASGKAATPRSELLPLLRLNALLFGFLTVLGLSMVAGIVRNGSALVSVGANGLFCLAWGLLLVRAALRRARPVADRVAGADPRFLADFPFSPREAEVIGLLVQGLPNKEIAERLFISARTVETHVYNIYRKCGCRNKVELVNKARAYEGSAPA